MREVGVFDDTGSLYLYGNLPDSYKPLEVDGAYSDGFVRVKFALANASIVALQINPNVAVASQAWVLNTITMAALLPGGTTNQVATKASNADGDIEGRPQPGGRQHGGGHHRRGADPGGRPDGRHPDHLHHQRPVALHRPGRGGERLRPDQWTPDGTDHTKLTLAASYPAGTKLHAVQNDPQGDIPPPLLQQQNLADLANKATARSNLGVYSKSEVDLIGFRPGMKIEHYGQTPPAGTLAANGAAVSRVAYAALFAAIGTPTEPATASTPSTCQTIGATSAEPGTTAVALTRAGLRQRADRLHQGAHPQRQRRGSGGPQPCPDGAVWWAARPHRQQQ
jgi:hypothetical protein